MTKRYMTVTYILKAYSKWDEITNFKNSLNKNDLSTAKVIFDFKEKKMIKNTINPDAGFDDMLEFYKRLIGDQLTPFLPKENE